MADGSEEMEFVTVYDGIYAFLCYFNVFFLE